jgi:hypothetical protein
MQTDMNQLAAIARQQAAQAGDAERRLARTVQMGVRVLLRNEHARILRTIIVQWR